MIQFAHIADDNPDLALSPLLRAAQLTLEYIEGYCQTNVAASILPCGVVKAMGRAIIDVGC